MLSCKTELHMEQWTEKGLLIYVIVILKIGIKYCLKEKRNHLVYLFLKATVDRAVFMLPKIKITFVSLTKMCDTVSSWRES